MGVKGAGGGEVSGVAYTLEVSVPKQDIRAAG